MNEQLWKNDIIEVQVDEQRRSNTSLVHKLFKKDREVVSLSRDRSGTRSTYLAMYFFIASPLFHITLD